LTRTFRVELEIPNPDMKIADCQTADILIASDGKAAHLIPQSSLTLDDSGALGVRTILADNATKFVEISLLRDTPNGVWVSGLDPEVSIIVVGQEYVINGIVVDPTYRELGQ
jgi:multidrug efflux system membrane fusion protein